jgi:protein-tyrosine phosphatase
VAIKHQLLFVCLGNICRSPLAEAICQDKLRQRGWSDTVSCDSCGTGGYHVGAPADPRSVAIAKKYTIPIAHRARQLDSQDFEKFDLILVMDKSNYTDVIDRAISEEARAKVALIRKYDPTAPQDAEVPDPYYGGDNGFETVYQMLERSVEGLLQQISIWKSN